MPREILRFPYSTAELVLLESPGDCYEIEIYWRQDGYYERLAEMNVLSLHGAQSRRRQKRSYWRVRSLFFVAAREALRLPILSHFSCHSLSQGGRLR
jgi:hypothetical protein